MCDTLFLADTWKGDPPDQTMAFQKDNSIYLSYLIVSADRYIGTYHGKGGFHHQFNSQIVGAGGKRGDWQAKA